MTKQTQTATVLKNKQEQMKAARAAFFVPKLTKVNGINEMDLYVKRLSAGEVSTFDRLSKSFETKYPNDGLNGERKFSLELFNEDGTHYFDYDDVADMEFLREMPIALRHIISAEMVKANTGMDSLKND